MKGLCRLFVAVKTVSQIKYGQNKVGGGGGKGGARGEGQEREGGRETMPSFPRQKKILMGLAEGLSSHSRVVHMRGGGGISNMKHMSG